jgi:hypothetical protein
MPTASDKTNPADVKWNDLTSDLVKFLKRKFTQEPSADGPVASVAATPQGNSPGTPVVHLDQTAEAPATQTSTPGLLAWGARVSPAFRDKVRLIASGLEVDPNFMMASMAFETGGSFNPAQMNNAGSGAVGLIQFMPNTAKGLGTTSEALAAMTAEEQLDYVEKYFAHYKGRLHSLPDVYMAILWPAAAGKPDAFVLFSKAVSPITYQQNRGLDLNGDGLVTKSEAASKVQARLTEGLQPENAA